MKDIAFTKLTCYGSSFVFIDETHGPLLDETEMASFARYAVDREFGIGADRLIVLQPASEAMLGRIRAAHGYWDDLPHVDDAEYIVRVFHDECAEAECSGNGLLCAAQLLFERFGITATRVVTEVPRPEPNVVSIGFDQRDWRAWVNLGAPRKCPPGTVASDAIVSTDDAVELLSDLRVRFRTHDSADYTNKNWLDLSGYLVSTGEPHFVVLTELGVSAPCLFTTLFGSREDGEHRDQRESFGGWLLERVGHFLNHERRDLFPHGVNVSFARIRPDTDLLEYRCFERGVERETFSCGTAALAVASVGARLGLAMSNPMEVIPYRCALARPDARMVVERAVDGWSLRGEPAVLFTGAFRFRPGDDERRPSPVRPVVVGNANVTPLVVNSRF